LDIPVGPPGSEDNAKRICSFGLKGERRPQGTFLDKCRKEDPWKIIEKYHKYQALSEAYWQLWILTTVYNSEEVGVKELLESLKIFVKKYGEE